MLHVEQLETRLTVVDTDKPRLPREFREKVEVHLFHLEKHGLFGHLERRGFASYGGMKAHIWGLLTYAHHVNEEFAEPLMERLNHKLPLADVIITITVCAAFSPAAVHFDPPHFSMKCNSANLLRSHRPEGSVQSA